MSDFRDEILKALSKEIQREIDEEIMIDILVQQGWTKVYLKFEMKNFDHLDYVYEWLFETNNPQDWKRIGNYFVFRESKHAEWFILKWC